MRRRRPRSSWGTSSGAWSSKELGRALIALGVILVAIGILVQAGVPIGRLPGDIVVRRGNSTFYFPLVTCLLASVILSLVMALLRR